MQAVNWQSFGWKRNYVRVYPLGETPYNAWKIVGMPRIPDAENLAFFMYKNEGDAKRNKKSGATGFIVTVPYKSYGSHVPKDTVHRYVVTNEHVVNKFDGATPIGATTIRINTGEGCPPFVRHLPIKDWIVDKPNDIAVCPIELEDTDCEIIVIELQTFVTNYIMENADIGIGEDVFMVGRFVDHTNTIENEPVARFGCISHIAREKGSNRAERFFVDMHSRTGYSGSPVIVYRTPRSNMKELFEHVRSDIDAAFIFLLGVHKGSFPEEWEVHRNYANKGDPDHWKELKTIGASGLSQVIPAQYLHDLLMNDEDLIEMREQREKEEENNRAEDGFPFQDENHEDGGDITGDEILETMLNTPPETHEEIKDK
ncbi:MAG: trypsin-like peptidase domain-containing protein [Proteobacteria bacterium]|nr:trypsin-like peptidase domain-containing protein [Pseudomonadota bacterium]